MKRWLSLAIAAVAIALVIWGFVRSDEERLPLAKAMIEKSADWFKVEHDLGSFGADVKAGTVEAIGVADRFALVTLKSGEKYYLRTGAPPGTFAQFLADNMGEPGLQIVSVGNLQPPTNLIAQAASGVSMFALIQLLSLAFIVLLALQMTNVLDFGGGFDFEKAPKARFADVIGCTEAKAALADICAYLKDPTRFVTMGAKPPKGVLMAGPPGTGKTLLARALAGECGVPVIVINGASFSDKFMGVGVQRVKKLFKKARSQGRCVIFIDEIDGIGHRGSGSGGAADTENSRIVNALLVALDGYQESTGVIVVGATNHIDAVDPALRRDGRFDRSCYLTLPNIDERESLFRHYGETLTLDAQDHGGRGALYRQLARMSVGLSPATIAGVVNDAAVLAVKEGDTAVRLDHFRLALEQKRLGSPTDGVAKAMTAKERERVAVHEAGHAILARLGNVGAVEKVTIVPRAQALGVTLVTDNTERFLQTESELRNHMDMLLGGRVAERILLKEGSTGAVDDLKRASDLALRMASEFGFNTEDGPFSFAALDKRDFPEARERALRAASRWVSDAEERAENLLRGHLEALKRLSALLLEHETVNGEVVDCCIANPEIAASELPLESKATA